jgi:hypothetical protein
MQQQNYNFWGDLQGSPFLLLIFYSVSSEKNYLIVFTMLAKSLISSLQSLYKCTYKFSIVFNFIFNFQFSIFNFQFSIKMMQQKILFTVAGLGDIVKTKLYTLVPVIDDTVQSSNIPYYHDVKQPLHGTVANRAIQLGDILGKNMIVPLLLKVDGESMEIPEAVVSVTKKKTIVSTSVVGGTGTVKEFICDDDMDISITLGIASVDALNTILDEYPAENMQKLMKILDSKKEIEVWSPFLELFDLDGGYFKMVVTEYTVGQSTHTNRQVVNINAVSDYDYTIFSEEF